MWQGAATHNSFFIEMEQNTIFIDFQEDSVYYSPLLGEGLGVRLLFTGYHTATQPTTITVRTISATSS